MLFTRVSMCFFLNTTKTITDSFTKRKRQAHLLRRLCVWNLGWISRLTSSLNAPNNQKSIAKIFLMVFLILMNQSPLGVHHFSNTTFSTTSICSSVTIDAFQNFMLFLPLPLKVELAKLVSSRFTSRPHLHHQKLMIQDVTIVVSPTKLFSHHSCLRMALSWLEKLITSLSFLPSI